MYAPDDQNDELIEEILEIFLDFDPNLALDTVKKLEGKGVPKIQIAELFRAVLERIGEMFDQKDLFLTELVMAGEILKQVMKHLALQQSISEPANKDSEKMKKPHVVIGTVEGDIHDIGKNIVASILQSNGYRVVDLGVDLSPLAIIEAVRKYQPKILALSSLLTAAYESMKNTVKEMENAGLRDSVKIMIGGGAVDQSVCEYVGADAHGDSATDAIKLAKKWLNAAESEALNETKRLKTRG